MSEVSLFELLKEGDIDNCYQFSDKASLGGKDLVEYQINNNQWQKKLLSP